MLSACLIVRDEEEMLPACLRSLTGAADEIVVVDTGSADATPDIARRAGARVLSFPWGDDFAAARNAALDQARGRWVLQIDADERLTGRDGAPLSAAALRRWLCSPPPECRRFDILGLRLRNAVAAGRWETETVQRLFVRQPGRRYRRRVHETFLPRGQPHPWFFVEDVEIRHLGYLPDIQRARGKAGRNLRLCRLALAEDPDDPELHYHYGFELCRAGRAAEGTLHLGQAWDRAPAWAVGSGLWWRIIVHAAEMMNSTGAPAEVLARLDPLLRTFPDAPYLHFLRGEALRKLNRPRDASACFRTGLSLPLGDVAWEPWNTRPNCWNGIGLVCEQTGRREAALRAYRRSLALGPTPCAQNRLAALEAAEGPAGTARPEGATVTLR